MEDKKKIVPDINRPKDMKEDWDTTHCPWFIFGEDEAAEYDIQKMKAWFKKKFKKHG